MQFKLTGKSILITVVVLVLVAFILFKLKPFTKVVHGTDAASVAACQKQVESTYTNLTDTSDLVAPGTTTTIQKQEQDAKNACITSNTH